ncbi:Heavy-metal-associated domain protein [Pirellulimonas nuda]|uniref:Heavy-metal-associated domain protein n=1 Tax=Pirellulimonas nuda TaxID=2528009 RepID=A0A518D8H5_9BACT|nr:heavy-metal-associated domain-containing protein [Pirellulimonas nuda]QDU87777.1 Heavy-metal-associated domain protein [Pirellulimonas nuda]
MKLYPLVVLAALVGCSTSETLPTTTVDASPAAAPQVFNVANLPTVSISTPSMHCEVCAAGIEEVLAGASGVKDVKCDVDSHTVTLAVDESEFDKDAAIASLDKAGFSESVVQ